MTSEHECATLAVRSKWWLYGRAPALRAATWLVATILSAGCGDVSSPRHLPPIDPFQPLSVSNTGVPVFNFSRGCGADYLVVSTAKDDSSRWGIRTMDAAIPLAAPITYGKVPAAAIEFLAPATLVAGERYRVTLLKSQPQLNAPVFGLCDQAEFIAQAG
jgi:hypothetical protein